MLNHLFMVTHLLGLETGSQLGITLRMGTPASHGTFFLLFHAGHHTLMADNAFMIKDFRLKMFNMNDRTFMNRETQSICI